jgi:hypothetical protein
MDPTRVWLLGLHFVTRIEFSVVLKIYFLNASILLENSIAKSLFVDRHKHPYAMGYWG